MIYVLVIIAVLLCLYFVYKYFQTDDVIGDYETVIGYEDSPKIDKIVEKCKKKPTASTAYILSNVQKYNKQDQEESDYWMAVALNMTINDPNAVYEAIEPEHIMTDVQFVLPAGRLAQVTNNVEKLGAYYERKVSNDPQNVHDNNVQCGVREKYFKLPDKFSDLDDLKLIASERANFVIRDIENKPAYMDSITGTDYDALKKVWARFKEKNIPATSLISALENCRQEGYTICTVGRVSNIMDSLTLLDDDIGEPVPTIDMLRKDALGDAYKIINELPEPQKKIYEGVDSEERDTLCEELSRKIQSHITENYSDKIKNEEQLNKIILDAQSGLS